MINVKLRKYGVLLAWGGISIVCSTQSAALPVEQACPQHPDIVIEGRACNYKAQMLRYKAIPVKQTTASSHFNAGAQL
jgi:hypothetical protein